MISCNDATAGVTVRVEVNKPFRAGSWSFYQYSYDESQGKWSDLSIPEAVYDPWLPLVYTGIFMLLAGSIYLLWTGNKNKHYDKLD